MKELPILEKILMMESLNLHMNLKAMVLDDTEYYEDWQYLDLGYLYKNCYL
jgi:hypothetical protein